MVIRGAPKVSSYAARFICGKAAQYFSYGVSRSGLECGRRVLYQPRGSTLPVIALGVGVDYGIYLYERFKHHLVKEGASIEEAFFEALRQRGTAAVFTAITMSVGVGSWAFSALKFQADMGILLAFMFLVNMLGAILLLPALAALLLNPRQRPS